MGAGLLVAGVYWELDSCLLQWGGLVGAGGSSITTMQTLQTVKYVYSLVRRRHLMRCGMVTSLLGGTHDNPHLVLPHYLI